MVITDLSQPRPKPAFGGLPPIKHAETCDGPTRQPLSATLSQGYLHGAGGVYTTGKAYKKGIQHPKSRPGSSSQLIRTRYTILDCLFRHAIHNIFYFLVQFIKMKFSTTLIAFVAAGLASAQLPDVPACSVRRKPMPT